MVAFSSGYNLVTEKYIGGTLGSFDSTNVTDTSAVSDSPILCVTLD